MGRNIHVHDIQMMFYTLVKGLLGSDKHVFGKRYPVRILAVYCDVV